MSIDSKALGDAEASLFLKIAQFLTTDPTEKCEDHSRLVLKKFSHSHTVTGLDGGMHDLRQNRRNKSRQDLSSATLCSEAQVRG